MWEPFEGSSVLELSTGPQASPKSQWPHRSELHCATYRFLFQNETKELSAVAWPSSLIDSPWTKTAREGATYTSQLSEVSAKNKSGSTPGTGLPEIDFQIIPLEI